MVRLVLPLRALALFALSTVSIGATPLPPGATESLSGSTLSAHPEWAGGLNNDALIPWEIRNASNAVILTGTIQNRVSVSNTTGNLVIAPRLRDLASPTGTARIVRYVTTGFDGTGIDVDYRLDGSGEVGPDTVSRSAEPGGTLDFDFTASPVAPPESARFLMMSVDTAHFRLDGTATIYAEEAPGGDVFSSQVTGTATPFVQQRLDLLSVTRDAGGQITLTWAAMPNTDYEIQRSSDAESWFTFRSKMATSTLGFDTFTPAAGTHTRLYRVILP